MRSGKYAVRLLSIAEQDLQELISYLAAENFGAAVTTLDHIEAQLQALQRLPFLGRVLNDPKLARLGYRMLVIDNYLVFYKVKGKDGPDPSRAAWRTRLRPSADGLKAPNEPAAQRFSSVRPHLLAANASLE